MRNSPVSLALLFSSLALIAQDRASQVSQTFSVPAQTTSLACPVSMQAQQRGSSQLVEVRNGKRMQPAGQRISLTLHSTQSPRILSARVTARGLAPKAHVLQSKGNDDLSSQITRTISVTFGQVLNGSVTGELILPGFTSVTSIGLEEIAYENGTLWRVGEEGVCRVAPDMFMLISDR